MGTLVAAVASYLQARTHSGEWLLRIEDVDTLRRVEGATDSILKTLDSYGFEWDGDVVLQSERTALYQQALECLQAGGHVFPCTCSRKLLRQTANDINGIYPGTCRERTLPLADEHAIRMRADDRLVQFDDAVTGSYQQNLAGECGDFVIRRRDGLFAYQLTVVVDDELQGITEVVRGTDLLDSTPRQIYLQHCLGYSQPGYLHVPLLLGSDGRKLSKSEGAIELEAGNAARSLHAALEHLGQQPPEELQKASVAECWLWAVDNWSISKIPA